MRYIQDLKQIYFVTNLGYEDLKVGTHERTSRRDLFQGLVLCRVYTGQVARTSSLKGLHKRTCYTSK